MSARLPVLLGFSATILLVLSVGVWSTSVTITGAVVAPGVVIVESRRQVVQHPDGGVVSEVFVDDGDRVSRDQILLRLDDTFLRNELMIAERQLAETWARRMRLVAERGSRDVVEFGNPPSFQLLGGAELEEQVEAQATLFEIRRNSLSGQIEQIDEQIFQIQQQIIGQEAQLESLEGQLPIVNAELDHLTALLDENLVQSNAVLSLRRDRFELQGEIGELVATMSSSRARIAELRIAQQELLDARLEATITELRDLRFAEIEIEERGIAIREQLGRLDVVSPGSGVVIDRLPLTQGSVIVAAEPILSIVPDDLPFLISCRIRPQDIDEVYPGQTVSISFTSYERRAQSEVTGILSQVSADSQMDDRTGEEFFEVLVDPDLLSISGNEGLVLTNGMPVEVFLETVERTPLSYLLEPLRIYFDRAFR
ncbi:HlyD family type I secretion periplasmic adaptor subunit [Rhodobacterales bacterium HKCCSP123]|nr:HlyD family type I secretion periplasmic adaptor subunit [Rhodobacterales bacterium HKCCSP123]